MSDDAQYWAHVVKEAARESQVNLVIDTINILTREEHANHAEIIVACAQILAQSITLASPDIAREIRLGVMSLIDGFATQHAIQKTGDE